MCFHIKASLQPPPPFFFFWSLCFILILSYIIVFTWSSIIYKHTKHSSLVSQLVLIREVPTKSAELQRFAPEKNLACCPCRPLLPSTAHMRKERIKKKKKCFLLSIPRLCQTHASMLMPTETCSPPLTYFSFVCLQHASRLLLQPAVLGAVLTLPRPRGSTGSPTRGSPPGTGATSTSFSDR